MQHEAPASDTAFLMAIDGAGVVVRAEDVTAVGEHTVALFDHDGERLVVPAGEQPFHALLATGRPIGERVVFGGPFVMNTQAEIHAARGEMGRLTPSVDFGRAPRR